MIDVWDAQRPAAPIKAKKLVLLAGSMGTETFAAAFEDCLRSSVNAAHFSVIRMEPRRPALMSAGTQHRDRELVFRCYDAYAEQFHAHDQLFNRMQRMYQAGASQLIGRLRAEDIAFLPYRRAIYLSNGMSERLSGLCTDADGVPILFNLYRHEEQARFSDAEIAAFQQLVPALVRLLSGHRALCEKQRAPDYREILLRLQPDLSEREIEVCTRLLRGMTYAGIAADIGLKESTVKTYRNRAFLRLGIHFKSELFARIRA